MQADKKSLICLLLPFFGLWALFWLVPIILGFDLSLQNPNRLVAHWEDVELANDKQGKNSFSWLVGGVQDVDKKRIPNMWELKILKGF